MIPARRVWDVLEPIAAKVYFAPEVHGALEKLGFGGGTPGPNGIHYPDGPAYFNALSARFASSRRNACTRVSICKPPLSPASVNGLPESR